MVWAIITHGIHMIEQLQLFPPTADELNARRIEEVFDRVERVRKGTYASIGDVNKRLMRIEELIEHLTRYICIEGKNNNIIKEG